MNKIYTLFVFSIFQTNTWASDGGGIVEATILAVVLLYVLAAIAIGVIIYGVVLIRNTEFITVTNIVVFNIFNIVITLSILLLLNNIGFSYIGSTTITLVIMLGIIQIYMFYKLIRIYRHKK